MSLRIVIVGGVAGGATAAAKARRENEQAEITVFERGPYVSFANCGLPYYLGGEITSREKLLLMTPKRFWDRYRISVYTHHEVLKIDRSKKVVLVEGEGKVFEKPYDKLILSQGAAAIVPPFKGVDQKHVFTLRDIPDMDRIDEFLKKNNPKTAVVIGGGFIGLEMAEAFFHRDIRVTVIEKAPHILPLLDNDVAAELTEILLQKGLQIRSGIGATELGEKEVILEDGTCVPADMVLLSVGVKPEIKLAREAGLAIGNTGGVRANGRMESSDPDIYAVGDAAETTHLMTGSRVRVPLAGPANRQGRVAGANAAGGHLTYPGTLGTSIVRILNHTIGYTGLNSRQAREAGFSFFSSMTRDNSHASYYPGAKSLLIKILVEEGTGRILGAQVLGEEAVDKRVDVFATAIFAKMCVADLESLDLAYAPPFGSANDPANVAAFVASHEVRGDIRIEDPAQLKPQEVFLLDVRTCDELKLYGKIAGASHIPLDDLRDSLNHLPVDQRIVVYCQKGQRGYLATQILKQSGFSQACNLKGGFLQARFSGVPIEKA